MVSVSAVHKDFFVFRSSGFSEKFGIPIFFVRIGFLHRAKNLKVYSLVRCCLGNSVLNFFGIDKLCCTYWEISQNLLLLVRKKIVSSEKRLRGVIK